MGEPLKRDRVIGWGLVGAGVLGLVVFYWLLPDIQNVAYCSADGGLLKLGENEWLAFHDPQLGDGMIRYDAENNTTLIVPGCGHGTLYAAIKLRGDHSDLQEPFRLLVGPVTEMDGSTEPLHPPFQTRAESEPVDEVFTVAFVKRDLGWHLAAFTTALAALGTGVAVLSRVFPSPMAYSPLGGLLGGWSLSYLIWAGGGGFGAYLFTAALVVFPGFVGSLVALMAKRRPVPEAVSWFLLAFAAALFLGAIGFAEAFPAYPEA